MNDVWSRIDDWLGRHFPQALEVLPAGASEAAVRRVEDTIGCELPDEVRRFLLRHDGSGELALHDEGGWFLSTDEIVEAWHELTDLWVDTDQDQYADPAGPIRARWWHSRWVPVATDGMGNYLCLDMDPLDGGTMAQVFWWCCDEGPTEVSYPSLTEMMTELAEELEQGKYADRGMGAAGNPYLHKPDAPDCSTA